MVGGESGLKIIGTYQGQGTGDNGVILVDGSCWVTCHFPKESSLTGLEYGHVHGDRLYRGKE